MKRILLLIFLAFILSPIFSQNSLRSIGASYGYAKSEVGNYSVFYATVVFGLDSLKNENKRINLILYDVNNYFNLNPLQIIDESDFGIGISYGKHTSFLFKDKLLVTYGLNYYGLFQTFNLSYLNEYKLKTKQFQSRYIVGIQPSISLSVSIMKKISLGIEICPMVNYLLINERVEKELLINAVSHQQTSTNSYSKVQVLPVFTLLLASSF